MSPNPINQAASIKELETKVLLIMNVFMLHPNMEQNAQWHRDDHVTKLIVESAQIMCTTARIHGDHDKDFMYDNISNPSIDLIEWCAESIHNFEKVREYAEALHDEYQYRYGEEKVHKSIKVIRQIETEEVNLPEDESDNICEFGMDDDVKADDPYRSYRRYYIQEKKDLDKYKYREAPEWLKQEDSTLKNTR